MISKSIIKNLHRVVLFLIFGLTSFLLGDSEGGNGPNRLMVGDELQLSVVGQADLSKLLKIDGKGEIELPLIEEPILFFGLTPAEAAEEVRKTYADGYLKAPVVNLQMSEYVHVGGQVVTPGAIRIPFDGPLDLITALSKAGGVTGYANSASIELLSAGGNNLSFTLAEVEGERGKQLLTPGDQVIVSGNRTKKMAVSMEGEIMKPGPIPIPKGRKLDLATAIAKAEGPTLDADQSRIELIPADGKKPSIFTQAAIRRGNSGKTLLRGGDRVRIGKSPFVNTGIIIILEGVAGKKGFMPFPLNGKFSLNSAISLTGLIAVVDMKNVQVSRVGSKTLRYNMTSHGSEVWLQPGDTIRLFEN